MIGPQVKREFFTQLPNKLIDSDISANAFKGFVRMLRDREIMQREKFAGSIRKLANRIKMPTMTVKRMVTEWEKADLVYKEVQPKADENREEMVLYLLIDSLWMKNNEASRKECTKLVQCSDESVPNWYSDVPNDDTDVPNRYSSVPKWDNIVPTVSVNETTNTISNTIVDTSNNTNLEREENTRTSTPDVQPFVAERNAPSQSSSSSQESTTIEITQANEQDVRNTHAASPIATPSAQPTPEQSEQEDIKPVKPKRTQEPKITQAQIDRVFETMNEVLRSPSVYGQPDFSLVPSRKATDEVKQLIKAKALPSVLKAVILDMWNEYKNGEYWWRVKGRMTVPAICGQYSSRAPGLMPKVKLVEPPTDTPKAETVVDISRYETPLMLRMRERKAKFEASQLQQVKG